MDLDKPETVQPAFEGVDSLVSPFVPNTVELAAIW